MASGPLLNMREHAPHACPQAEGLPKPPRPHEVPLQFGTPYHCSGVALGGMHRSHRTLERLAQEPVAPTVTPSPEAADFPSRSRPLPLPSLREPDGGKG